MYKLVISDDEGKTTVVPLIRDEITIGRKEGNTIRLTERNVSRFHARVIREDDKFILEDLGSLCGTHVNAKILRSESIPVTSGDNMAIGDYSLSIRSDVAADVPMGKQMDPGDQTGIGKVTAHARLVMISGPDPGREQDLTAELYVVGRSEEANLRINHPSISRAHARIDLESGKWTISDLDSINGIFINNIKKDDYVLKAGDVIRLGSVELRFVAPGEPYDFEPSPDDERFSHALVDQRKPKGLGFLYVGASLLIAAAIVGVYMWYRAENETVAQLVVEDFQTYESLLEEGKDKMQSEAWSEAARLFALAIQKNPSGNEARDLKNMAIQEADAQVAFNAGLQAQENHNWKETIDHWSKIPISSHYYDLEQQKSISGKLCDELLEKASFVQKTASSADLDDVIHEIFEIPLAPKRCRGNRSSILAELERRAAAASKDGGILEGVNEAIIRRRMRAKRQTASAKTRTKRDGVSRHQKKEKPESSLQDKIMNPYDDE